MESKRDLKPDSKKFNGAQRLNLYWSANAAQMQRNSRLFNKAQLREQFGAQLEIGNKIRDLERNF